MSACRRITVLQEPRTGKLREALDAGNPAGRDDLRDRQFVHTRPGTVHQNAHVEIL